MKLLPWLLLIFGAGLVYVFWPDTSKPSARELELEAALERRTEAYNESERRVAKLLSLIKVDSVSNKIEVQAYKDRDKKRVAYIVNLKANPIVIKVREDVPLIDSAFQAYDSLLESKDQQLNLQEKYVGTLQMDIGELKANFEERLKLQRETIEDLNAIVDDQRKTIRKERRAKRLAKVVSVGVVVVGFLVGAHL